MDRSGRGRDQAGVTLLEVMIAMVIIAIVVVGLISGLFTMIRASDENENRQRIEAALVSFGNSVKEMPYRACGVSGQPASAPVYEQEYKTTYGNRWIPAASTGMTVESLDVLSVEYWNPTPSGGNPAGWDTTCPAEDYGIQRLTVQITRHDEVGTAQIVKRRPAELETP